MHALAPSPTFRPAFSGTLLLRYSIILIAALLRLFIFILHIFLVLILSRPTTQTDTLRVRITTIDILDRLYKIDAGRQLRISGRARSTRHFGVRRTLRDCTLYGVIVACNTPSH